MTRKAKGPKADIHARAKMVAGSKTAQRVELIRRLMVSQAWGPQACERLAEEWQVTAHRVSTLATEASRSLRVDAGQLEHYREMIMGTFAECVRRALEDRSSVTGQCDIRAAIEAAKELARYQGIAPAEHAQVIAPVVINVTAEVAQAFAPPVIEMTPVLEERVVSATNGSGQTH